MNIDEEILLCDMLGVERVDLYAQHLSLSESQSIQFEDALKKRTNAEPLQYIIGKTEFFGLQFFVEPGVFIPRPETEVLVESVLKKWGQSQTQRDSNVWDSPHFLLDLCTGSGCIAICLAKYAKCGKIVATDISQKSLEIAARNAALNGVGDKIDFKQADLFDGLSGKFDIIVCNPPYIRQTDLETLPKEVKYEPQIALDGGIDGLDFYRKIALGAPEFLEENGILLLEMGDSQAQDVKNMFRGSAEIIKDLNGIERVLIWGNKG